MKMRTAILPFEKVNIGHKHIFRVSYKEFSSYRQKTNALKPFLNKAASRKYVKTGGKEVLSTVTSP